MLAIAPLAFDSIFLVSFCLAVLGLGILVLFVNGRERAEGAVAPERTPSLRGAFALVQHAALPCSADRRRRAQPRHRERRVRVPGPAREARPRDVPVPAAVRRQRRDVHGAGRARWAACRTASAAAGSCWAATRSCSGSTSCSCAPMAGWLTLALVLGLLGSYYAATDGVLMALGSAVVPDEVRGSGLALLGTTTSVARLIASVAFGAVWMVWGLDVAFVVLRRRPRRRRRTRRRRARAVAGARVSSRTRGIAFAVLALACVAGVVVAVVAGMADTGEPAARGRRGGATRSPTAASSKRTVVVFRALKAGQPEGAGQMAVSAAEQPAPPHARGDALRPQLLRRRARHLPRARQRLRRGLPGAACSTGDFQQGATDRRRRRAEPGARLLRRPLRRRDDVRHGPLLRRRRRVLDPDDAARPRRGARRSPSSRSSP